MKIINKHRNEKNPNGKLYFTHQRLVKKYNQSQWNFASFFSGLLGVGNELERLHILRPDLLPSGVVQVENDQDQKIYEFLYKVDSGFQLDKPIEAVGSLEGTGFLSTYHRFVAWLATEVFGENLVYQARPTLRVSFPGNKAVGDWHRDSDYNHPIEEINLWVPLTDTSESNTIWIESFPDRGDYEPMIMKYGEFLIFDGILKHGNVINRSGGTRLSFDFRVIPASTYVPLEKRSYSRSLKFGVGEYYAQTLIDFA